MRIILPKQDDPQLAASRWPIFFLAGPVRGGGDWQRWMSSKLDLMSSRCTIACPCRWGPDHPLARYFISNPQELTAHQREWERIYLEKAGVSHPSGCIVFWLANESRERPHPGPEPYAMQTRGELGEWRWRMKTEGARCRRGRAGFFRPQADPVRLQRSARLRFPHLSDDGSRCRSGSKARLQVSQRVMQSARPQAGRFFVCLRD